MERTRHDLVLIGTFASATQLSLKALRLYAQLGILVPALVDPDNGYRYYDTGQLRQGRLIRMLRQMDMPLATIRSVLVAEPADAVALIDEYCRSMEARVVKVRSIAYEAISFVKREDTSMTWQVEVRNVAPQHIISMTRNTKIDGLVDHITGSIGTLVGLAQDRGMAMAGPPFGIYHGPVNDTDDGPMEVCLPVREQAQVSGEVAAKTLDAAQVAYVDIAGDQCEFPAILKAYDAVYDWIAQNGYQQAGSPWEIYTSEEGNSMQIAWPFRA